MANQVISDEELMLLLSTIYHSDNHESQEKPKLTMKLLYELIKKLKEENMMLTNRMTEYERQIDLLLESKNEIASTLEVSLCLEHGKLAEIEIVPNSATSMNYLVPRSVRHPDQKKTPLWLLLLKSSFRLLFRRRKGYLF